MHAKLHVLPVHVAWAWATVVVHTLPQVLQSLALLVVSTQDPEHRVGVPEGHPDAHWYVAPEAVHTGVVPLHPLPQLPQFEVVAMFVSQPRSGLPLQCIQPVAHADGGKEQAPPTAHVTAPLTCGRFVQSWPQAPQFFVSFATQPPSQTRSPEGHPPPSDASEPPPPPSPASPPPASIVAASPSPGASGDVPSCAASGPVVASPWGEPSPVAPSTDASAQVPGGKQSTSS